jgi:flagellar hook protein FlgE
MVYSRVGILNTDKDGNVTDASGRMVQGYAATPGSTALGGLGDLKVPNGQIPAMPSDKVQYVANLSSSWPAMPASPPGPGFDSTDERTFNSSMVTPVYDSLGSKHTLRQFFVKTGDNQIDVHYTFDGAAVATTQTLQFSTNGQLTSPTAPVSLALGTPPGASALTVAMDYTGTTQFDDETTATVNAANGYASGTMIGVSLAEDGSVMAQYSNGEKMKAGTLALATFPDESALVSVNNTSWTTSAASGQALYFAPGSGMAGTLSVGSIEQSNVDMTGELVSLMSSQRNYQANTKVISTENEMMQSLMQAV